MIGTIVVVPDALGCDLPTALTPGTRSSSARSAVRRCFAPASGVAATTNNGPLAPGPKPLETRSYATRLVAVFALLPASGNPNRMPVSGAVMTSSSTTEASAASFGRRCTPRAQRAAREWSGSAGARPRPGTRRRSIRRPAKPSSAGSSVTLAASTTSTARLAKSATPYRYGRRMRNSPSIEMMTVEPAMTAERPAVLIASTVASSGDRPSASAVR